MISRRGISIFLLSLLLIFLMIYLIWAPESGKKEKLELESTRLEVLNEINETKGYIDNTTAWLREGETDIAYFHPPETEHEQEDTKKDVVKYFIAGLLENDVDIFLSSFHPQQISEDLFLSEEVDKVKVAKDIMSRISRGEQLDEIQYGVKNGILNMETNEISLLIRYKDGQESHIDFEVLSIEDSHEEEKNKLYVITTSAWDIVTQIENSTNYSID